MALAAFDEARARPIEETLEYGTELASVIATSIRELPEGQRQVVVMKLLEGRPFAEIAERLEVSEAGGNFSSSVSRRGRSSASASR